MKKLLLTLSLIGLTLGSALAQGTINPLNNIFTRFKIDINGDGFGDRNMTTADGMQFYFRYGPAGSAREQLVAAPGFGYIGATLGVLTGLPSVMALPGTAPGEIVSLEVCARNDRGWTAFSDIKQVTLGPTEGEGTVIWSSQAAANRFTPLVSDGGGLIPCIPEPSTLALGALAGAFLLFRVRKATNNN